MNKIFDFTTRIFDPLHFFWERDASQRVVAGMLVLIFLLSLGLIELNRQGVLHASFAASLPLTHYMAINLAFTLVLILEVVSLIFTLPCSISRALGKQFEILALIFLRSSFKELTLLPEPISIDGHIDVVWRILADGGGAIIIFALLGFYAGMLRKSEEKHMSGGALYSFVASKKMVALLMLAIFCGMGAYNGILLISGRKIFDFFHHFYTVLIFCDVLLVLISQCFQPGFRAVFRNSGYALATLLIRLALTAPPFLNVLIGVVSAVLALLLTLVYDKFYASTRL
ncbi:MAG: hypothetical protein HY885_12100 [Deltaproteobacteria bacterium]|nr:hypothetical protein [Deltaproteobacteria bacterium]